MPGTATLYHAEAALRRAFLRVKENHGCAGADEVTIEAFERSLAGHIDCLRRTVEDGSYFAWPLRRIEVEKAPGSTERRTLLVPAVRDRVLQTAVAAYMEPFLEAEFDECSFAYRRGRSVRMAVERVYQLYHHGYIWLLDADIEDFFSTVNRELVIGRLSTLVPDETVIRLVRLYLEAFEAAVSEPRERAPSGLREAWRSDVEKLAAAIRDGAVFAPYCEED